MTTTCPRDQSVLVAQGNSVPTIYRCDNCHGLWFPASAVAAVIGHAPHSNALALHGASASDAMRCPEDGKPLVRFLVDGVELDICSSCEGVWFDRGEVEYIRAKKAGTAPVVSDSDPPITRTLARAAGDAQEKLRSVNITPDVIILTTEVGARAIGTVVANPELTEQVAAAVGGTVDLAGAMPDALGSSAEVAPDIAGAIFELIAGAFSD